MQNKDEMDKLWNQLSKEKWKEVSRHGVEHLHNWKPSTEKEIEIWAKITHPKNLEKLEERAQTDLNPTLKKITEIALEECRSRQEEQNKSDQG